MASSLLLVLSSSMLILCWVWFSSSGADFLECILLLIGRVFSYQGFPTSHFAPLCDCDSHAHTVSRSHYEGLEELLGAQPSPELSLSPEILQSQMTMVP